MEDQYLIAVNGKQEGPLTLARLRERWRNGRVSEETLFWQEGMDEWRELREIADLLAPQQSRIHPSIPARSITDKRILPAFLLALFFGPFGAHRFYLGTIGFALLQLGLSVGSVFLFLYENPMALPSFAVSSIWYLADFIMIIVGKMNDGRGNLVTKWT